MNYEFSGNSCQLRHPRICKYFTTRGACKFAERCAYLHCKPPQDDIIALQKEICIITTRIDSIVKLLEALLKEESSLKPCDCDISNMSTTEIPQLDGNQTLRDDDSMLLELSTSTPSESSTNYFSSTCGTCNLTFVDRTFFNDHNSYQYYCSICEICFKTVEDSHDHEEEFHPGYPGTQPRKSQ